MTGEHRMLIDGELVESAARFPNINPATEEALGDTSDASVEDMARAIGAARRAFDETEWSRDPEFRARCLEQLKAAMEEAREELRQMIVAESGSPIMLTYLIQLDDPIKAMDFWIGLARGYDYRRELEPTSFLGQPQRGLLMREPVGVVGAITPFNFPLYLNLTKVGPALAAGCTVVLKPSPETPWSATTLGRLVAEKTDIPAGVINVVPSTSNDVAAMLTADPRVDMVSFTGSTATGRRIMAASAETVKKVHLELGGKSANIILPDGDLQMAIAMGGSMACAHAGQGCALYTRMLLPRARYDEAVGIAQEMFGVLQAGDPTDPLTLVGPLINQRQRERVLGLIEKAIADGARLLVGGGIPEDKPKGFFVQPTLLADVDPDSSIAQEEVFGPVLSIMAYDDEADAIRIANNSIYGLSGSVWSTDEEHALDVAARIRTGTMSINGGQWLDVTRPFGGYKQSGVGRENGVEGFEEYLESKVIALPG